MSSAPVHRPPLALAVCCLGLLCLAAPWRASAAICADGAAVSPDGRTFLVNKELGAGQRWTIAATLTPSSPPAIQGVTGVVFDTASGTSSFVNCTAPAAEAAAQSLLQNRRGDAIALQCSGSGPCDRTAVSCAEQGGTWTFIGSVEVPASFFLPRPCAAAPQAEAAAVSALPAARVPVHASESGPRSPVTFTDDKTTLLVNKDVNGERWAIALGLEPTGRGIERTPRRIYGNVYRPDSEPAFIFCEPQQDIDLTKPLSTCSLRCTSTGPCQGDLAACSAAWGSAVSLDGLPVGFFLPSAGFADSGSGRYGYDLGCPLPPCVARPEGGGSQASPSEDACPRRSCAVQAGSCGMLVGETQVVEGLGCACLASLGDCRPRCDVDQCGRECSIDLGQAQTATGACKPTRAQSRTCSCIPADADGVSGCGGVPSVACAEPDTCCADDPTAGCASNAGVNCAGTCVEGSGGLCAEREVRERSVVNVCGNGVLEEGELCDGDDVGIQTCRRQGFQVGRLRCAPDCKSFDRSGCSEVECTATLRFEPATGFSGTPATAVLTVSPAEYVAEVTSACLFRNNVRTKLFPRGQGIFATDRFICGSAPGTQTVTFSAWDAQGTFLCGGAADVTSLGPNPQVVDPAPCSIPIPDDPCDF